MNICNANSDFPVYEIYGEYILEPDSYFVENEIIVYPEARLIINAGTSLFFDINTGMTIFGALEVNGNENNKVVFEGNEWANLVFEKLQ